MSAFRVSVIDAIVRTDKSKPYTVYKVKVERGDRTWVVYRRYSEFYNLNQALTKTYHTKNFSLPRKKLVGNLKAEFIEGRRVSLHRYMQRLLQHPVVSMSDELEEFLASDDDDDDVYEDEGTSTSGGANATSSSGATGGGARRAGGGGDDKFGDMDAGAATTTSGGEEIPAPVSIDDFSLLKVIGKGSFGKVMLAKRIATNEIFAIKILNKKAVLQKGELDHVRSERNVLVGNLKHPFLVSMHYSFQTEDKLFFVMDYVNGGEMFFHLQRDRRFSEDRARFYAAEIALALGHLHSIEIVYRDLKPENILIGADGHVVLTDFGLCKEGVGYGDTTRTFCGTPEYLAPEVLRNEEHGRPVDWWCLGIVLYEMLTGLPPFYSEDRDEMYQRTLREEVYYPSYIAPAAKTLLEGLLQRDPAGRLGSGSGDVEELMVEPFFERLSWERLLQKKVKPPWMPKVRGRSDVSNIDEEFLNEPVTPPDARASIAVLSDSVQDNFVGFTFQAQSEIAAATSN